MNVDSTSIGLSRRRLRFAFLTWIAFPMVLVAGTFAIQGKFVAEKVATTFVMPAGIVAMLLLLAWLVLIAARQRFASLIVFLALSVYWLLSCPAISGAMMRHLESGQSHWQETSNENLDVVIVLGGGVGVSRFEQPQVWQSGDRAILAVELYQSGRVKKLITTGENIKGFSLRELSPAEATTILWKRLGVPEQDILQVGGRNTYEEIQNLKVMMADKGWTKVGLITSASHMPRVSKLAKKAGFEFVPVPADFRSDQPTFRFFDFFPTSGAMEGTRTALHEYIGILLGR